MKIKTLFIAIVNQISTGKCMQKSLKTKIGMYLMYEVIKKRFLRFVSDKLFISLDYFFVRKQFPNYKNPQTFSEKIQWVKVFGKLDRYTKYVDKLMVRDYIKETIGEQYLVPLLGVWDTFEDIDFDKLPEQFVLKATHGQGYVFVCKDKSTINKASLKKIVDGWMKENFYQKTREIQYKYCIPKIICEQYLEDESGWLTDYKIFCPNGEPYLIYVISGRFSEPKYDFLDLEWNKLPITYSGYPNTPDLYKKPKNLKEMIEIARKLAQIFPFVRVDLYVVNDHIYFGELTLTPGNGLDKFEPYSEEYLVGKLIDLKKY